MTMLFSTDIKGRVIRTAAVREEGYSIFYLLLMDAVDGEREAYGIACFYIDGEGGEDADVVYDVTSSSAVAEEIFFRITSGGVTPCTLYDVAEDLISGEISL